ncbi:MAG: YbbR-like domain-containing protein [Acidobacteria bacterium]|jgi:YbbR domain-containing protein|nr:YbbR-like domain-containing protein [Acidobacteriota bacterium]MBP8274596.1 YbbR-like domain-containing protein [Acidobacteriota bacterium]
MAWHPFRNIAWKVLALLMGTALWFTVSGDLAIERAIDDRPVTMKNTREGVTAIVMPSRVTITVRGSREELGTLQANEIAVLVDLAGLGPGQYKLPLHVDTPAAVDVSKVVPETVEVRIR